MLRRNPHDKIIPFPDKANKKGGKKLVVARKTNLTVEKVQDASSQEHLIPVRLPDDAEDDPPCRIGNIPWTELGSLYILKMRRHFPECWLLSNLNTSCAISKITFTGLCEIPEDADAVAFTVPSGSNVPLLRVRVPQNGASQVVEVANIIADPFGLKVFLSLVQAQRNRFFQTTDFELLPISIIDLESIESLNFSE